MLRSPILGPQHLADDLADDLDALFEDRDALFVWWLHAPSRLLLAATLT
jgi:hypothetical protein